MTKARRRWRASTGKTRRQTAASQNRSFYAAQGRRPGGGLGGIGLGQPDLGLVVVGQVQGMCTTGVPVSADHISQAEGFFAEALASHQSDENLHPANTAWDTTWIANYNRINSLYEELP